MTDQTPDQNRQSLTLLASLGIATHRLDQIRDAARLHRQQLIGSSELYAVIEAGAAVPSAVPTPAADRAGLREQIAEAIARIDAEKWGTTIPPEGHPFWRTYHAYADAVLPLLPASVDRATVLNEAADHLASQAANASPSARDVILADVAELRRLAVEARDGQTTQGEAPCSDRADTLRWAADQYATLTDQNEAYDREHGGLAEDSRIRHETVRDVVAGLRRMASEAEQPGKSTAERAYDLGLTDTEYRAQSHASAVAAVRAAIPGMYAHVGFRLEDVLSEADTEQPAGGAQQPELATKEPTPEQIAREHVTTLHLIGEQLTGIESWLWAHLADVRAARVQPKEA